MADATLAHSASCCKRSRRTVVCKGRGERHNDSAERCLWRVASLSECARAPCWCEVHEQRGANVYRMVEEFTKKVPPSTECNVKFRAEYNLFSRHGKPGTILHPGPTLLVF